MDLMMYLSLFISSFLASSLLPIASDGVLAAMLYQNYAIAACVIVATAGNWIGGMTSYWIGRMGKREWLVTYFGINEEKVKDVQKWIDKYGIWVALFCWQPFIGDPLVVALGYMRSKPISVSILMLIGRFVKYLIVALSTLSLL